MYYIIPVLIVLIDEACKFFVYQNVKGSEGFELLKGVLRIVYVENRGIAFGILGNISRYIFIILSSLIVCFMIYLLLNNKIKSKIFKIAALFIVGGGIGNIIDRVLLGYVIDYLLLSFFRPVCNLSDYFITAGSILMIIYILFYYEKEKDMT